MNNVRLLVVVAFLLLISGVIFVSVTTVRDPGTSSISGAVVYICSNESDVCSYDLGTQRENVLVKDPDIVFSYPSSNANGEIVSSCRQRDETKQFLCLTHSGENSILNADPSMAAEYGEFDINNSGQIVYQCSSGSGSRVESLQVCAFDVAEHRFRALNPNEYVPAKPDINDNGTVLFVCAHATDLGEAPPFTLDESFTPDLCSVNFDGSDFLVIALDKLWVIDYEMNGDGKIVFTCLKQDEIHRAAQSIYDFCSFDENNDLILVENSVRMTGNISMNITGEIVFPCEIVSATSSRSDLFTICYKRDLYAEPKDLLAEKLSGGKNAQISDSGQVVFVCYDEDLRGPFSREICVINSDGTGLQRLTFDKIDNGRPAFVE